MNFKKAFIAIILTTISLSAQAGVFCKDIGGVKNVLDKDGWECRDAFIYEGRICFTGKRSDAIDILNKLKPMGYFDGTDGEYITNAHYYGKKSIAFTIVDKANDVSMESGINRCTADFFKGK